MWAQQGQLEKALVESVVLTPRPRPDQQRQCRLSLHHHVRPPSRTNIHIATSQPSASPVQTVFNDCELHPRHAVTWRPGSSAPSLPS
jgi:hypothetical protein